MRESIRHERLIDDRTGHGTLLDNRFASLQSGNDEALVHDVTVDGKGMRNGFRIVDIVFERKFLTNGKPNPKSRWLEREIDIVIRNFMKVRRRALYPYSYPPAPATAPLRAQACDQPPN
jgi:hypothetical protein